MTGPQAGDRISEYVLDAEVGAGSFGRVWRAHHHIWADKIVAIKIATDAEFVRNLQKEGTTIHGLNHPNIVRAIGLDPYAPVPYFIMEFVDGPSLRALIDAHPGGLPVEAGRRIIIGMFRALDHAHANGVIHRDIKPANVLVASGPDRPLEDIEIDDVKVTDFGLGKAGMITANSILQSGSLLAEDGRSISGTLAYMAPEQRDHGETDARSDLYSVGIVLFEMMCGERPSGGDLPSQVRDGLPSWVDGVFARLYTRRERRLENAAEALAMIETSSVPPVILHASSSTHAPPPIPGAGARSCAACGGAVDPGDNFCILCGAQIVKVPRRCASCGAYPALDDRYCIFCGSELPALAGEA